MPKPINIAVLAALKREMAPLLQSWKKGTIVPGSNLCYEQGKNLVVIGGIGARAARRATEALLEATRPRLLVSAGLAGALTSAFKVGDLFVPNAIVKESGEIFVTDRGKGTLLTVAGMAGIERKRALAQQFSADAADMEAAAVAQVAREHGIPFLAVKAISDELDFPMPDLGEYVTPEGSFCTGKLISRAVLHPNMWGVLVRLKANSERAASSLCDALRSFLETGVAGTAQIASLAAAPRIPNR